MGTREYDNNYKVTIQNKIFDVRIIFYIPLTEWIIREKDLFQLSNRD